MLARLRTTWLAAGGATLLVLSMTGIVGATALVLVAAPQVLPTAEQPADTTATFEDLDGNNVDDACQAAVEPNPTAAASAQAAVDTNGDGVISTTEAAHSARTGGKNCNHGGYVSQVARASDAPTDENADAPTTNDCSSGTPTDSGTDTTTTATTDTTTETGTTDTTAEAPNAHGKAVSKVAQDETAIGGKNCNHGGAVSEVAKNKGDHPHGKPDATRKEKHSHGRGHN
jgi:hypothetical protein